MLSDFCNELVEVMESTFESEDALKIIEDECSKVNISPESLEPDDGSLIVLQLMSKVSGMVTEEKWQVLDNKFKQLLSKENPLKGRVRGLVLNHVLNYVAVKRGRIGAEEIRKRMKVDTDFKAECWYNIVILDELLFQINEYIGNIKDSRCVDIGHYVVSPDNLLTSYYWFGSREQCTNEVLQNISEILILNNFEINKIDNQITVEFEDAQSENIHKFFIGILEEICTLRKIGEKSIEIKLQNENKNIIILNYQEPGDDT